MSADGKEVFVMVSLKWIVSRLSITIMKKLGFMILLKMWWMLIIRWLKYH